MAGEGISVKGLWKRYGEVAAVKGIDLAVEKGEFVTLLGPSGSGKTTTLRMIAGLEQPDEGVIAIGGRQVSGPGGNVPAYQRNMGMVFQSYAVWPHKTIFENVAFPLKMKRMARGEERNRVERMLALVELPYAQFGERYPAQLSGGQQQRVALARALVADPDVILYDEPLSNLDARLRDSMRLLLRKVHDELDVTAVYVTHDQLEAMVLSDRVCVMNHGVIVQQGTPRELYERPADLFVAEFVGQANVLPIEAWAGEREVRVAGGVVVRLAEAGSPESGRNKLVIRHHQVRLLAAGQVVTGNAYEARVAEAVFLGDRLRYVFELAPGCRVVCEVPAEAGLPGVDDRVRVALPEHNCIVL